METKELSECLNEIKSQISVFDNKAQILLMVDGIVFGTSCFSIFGSDTLSFLKTAPCLAFVSLFFGLVLISIVLFIFVIFPRGASKEGRIKNHHYFSDVVSDPTILDSDENMSFLGTKDQIKQNAKIAKTKQLFIRLGIISLLLALASFAVLIILLICKVC